MWALISFEYVGSLVFLGKWWGKFVNGGQVGEGQGWDFVVLIYLFLKKLLILQVIGKTKECPRKTHLKIGIVYN